MTHGLYISYHLNHVDHDPIAVNRRFTNNGVVFDVMTIGSIDLYLTIDDMKSMVDIIRAHLDRHASEK